MSAILPPLSPFLGKNIGQICSFSIAKDNSKNHGAHFVSHVLGYDFAETCKNFTLKDKQASGNGATIRVEMIFNSCTQKGPWAARPVNLTSCLIFVTVSSNVIVSAGLIRMLTGPQKHVGIFAAGQIWNYSNTQTKVVADAERTFIEKFTRFYKTAGQTVEFFYGSL